MVAQPHVGTLGFIVYDITAKRNIYSQNSDSLMRPASCMKLLTCIAALRYLGTDYKYRNRLYTSGKMVNDTLVGDVVLKTQFDPCFNRDSLYSLVGALRTKGIKAVRGRVVLDMAFTDEMAHEEHWIIGDLHLRGIGSLYHGYRRFRNEVIGAMRYVAGLSLPDSAYVQGRLIPAKSEMIAEINTPLHVVVESALKYSNNTSAESLLYPLGYIVNKNGNYRKNGTVLLNNFLKRELGQGGIASVHDGCGLCPYDGLTPKILVSLLDYTYRHPQIYDEVFEDLPLAGTDGTLWDRMKKPNVLGKVKAKTGTLTREGGISTLSGYFIGKDGHTIAFSIMNNDCPVLDGRWWQDAFFSRCVFAKK